MATDHNNKRQWFWLGVRRLFSAEMSNTLSRLRSLTVTAFVGAALCTTAYAQTQNPSAKAPPSGVDQPSTQTPTQSEMDKADTDPNHWLTSNKGYLGYRYSKLAQINTQNVRNLKVVCSFKLGEHGSFQSAPLVYNGVLYATSVFGTFAIDAASCQKRWSYQYTPGAKMGQQNNKGAAISNGPRHSRHS
jgi:glucose dehydrogenase